MVNVLDIIYGIVKQFKACIPNTKHYLGNLPENYESPCFLYQVVFQGDKRQTKYIKQTTIDLQIIYLGVNDGYGNESYEDKLMTMHSLKSFLDTFVLKVEDRWLKFSYSFGEADEQLTINMDFKFNDSVINIEEVYELMETIRVNGKEV